MSTTQPIEHIVEILRSIPSPQQKIEDDTWEAIAIMAIALGLAPILHWHLEQNQWKIPPLAMAKLGVTRQAHVKRNRAIGEQLSEVLALCKQQRIDVLVLKGALLAPLAYPEAALRPMNDIDLLFRSQDLAKVGPLLESLGYVGKHKDADQGPGVTKHLSTYRRSGNEAATPNPYLSAGGDRLIEPHGSLEESWFGLKVDITPGVWERAESISLHGRSAYRLSTDDMLLHIAVHATFHLIMGSTVFVQLYDLGQVIKTWEDELDWEHVVALSQKAQAGPYIYAALFWAKTIFGTTVPDQALQALRQSASPDLVTYIESFEATAILKRTQQPPLVTLGQRLKRGLQDRHETARWTTSLVGKWRVWQTALAWHRTDTVHLLQKQLKIQS